MLPNHGANPLQLYKAMQLQAPETIIDFSENVNHLPFPLTLDIEALLPIITAYPHPDGEPFLSAVATYHGVEKEEILLGNGAAEIFALLGNVLANKRALIVHPTFSEYEATLTPHQIEFEHVVVDDIATYALPMQILREKIPYVSAIYLCTPNNPTGVLPPREELQQIIDWAQETATLVVLDEAFLDWIGEELSFITEAPNYDHVIVVRSMTKMYKMPGLRLGYAVANATLIQELARFTAHWHINGVASVVGAKMLMLNHYREKSIREVAVSRETTKGFLRAQGCITTASQTNYISFQLARPHESDLFYRFMLARGLVLRHSKNFRGMDGDWFRIGMKARAQMEAFEQGMVAWQQHRLSL